MKDNIPIFWFLKNFQGSRYKREFYVLEYKWGNDTYFAVSIEPNETGVTPIYICDCDNKETAQEICRILNDEKQRRY